MDDTKPGYIDVYNYVIKDPSNKRGLKLIGGGTGFGKTRGIAELIRQGLTDRKIIYCAHRKQLIDNMKKEIGDPLRYVVLPSNAEAIRNALQVTSPTLEEIIQEEQIFKWAGSDTKKQKSVIQAISRVRRVIDTHKEKALKHIQDEASHETSEIMKYFRTVLKTKAKEESDVKRQKTAQSSKRDSSKDGADSLLDSPVTYALFPFIEFQRTNKQILLTTVQKGFESFFDGKSNTNLSRIRGGGGYIVFLDEFDFLEEELLHIICKTSLVDDPFTFVEYFHREMTRHKLPHRDYATQDVQNRIKEIIDLIDTIPAQFGINYPAINQFTTHLKLKKEHPAIFSTSMTHLNQNLYLKQGNRSFEIYDQRELGSVDAVEVFKIVYKATQEILFLLLELREDDLTQYYEILQQCYGKTDFYNQVEAVHQVGRRTTERMYISLDALLDEGYGVYEIKYIGYKSDKDEAEFRYYSIFNTPERILRDLVKHNLVFALSATADIPRIVKHFDLEWLKRQEGVNFIPPSAFEEEIVRLLSRSKAEQRASAITVERLPELDLTNDFHQSIALLSREAGRHASQDGKDDESTIEHRQERAQMFYRVLLWAFSNPNHSKKMHLIFVNSFKQIQYSLNTPSAVIGASQIRETNKAMDMYHIHDFDGHEAIVIFYNAEAARALNDPSTLELFNAQFWKGKPVFVVTQYSSAGNGVNLQYLPTSESRRGQEVDFACLHLLEAPYYFFRGWNSQLGDAENITALKEDIWYCAKLYMSHALSRGGFLNILSDLRGAGINSRYHRNKNTRFDVICNQIAALIQALGRIERIWETMPAQTLMLSKDVFKIFQLYCTQPAFASIREKRDTFLSANLRSVQEQITQMAEAQDDEAQKHVNTQLAKAEIFSIEAVGRLLRRLDRLRAGNGDAKTREDWIQLRQAMLRHDFAAKVIQSYQGTCPTTHYHDGLIWVDKHLATYPDGKQPTDAQLWNFNSIYSVIGKNPSIRQHFDQQGFPLQFLAHLDRIPTRYFYQAILIGAIGEEAIQVLLARHADLDVIDDVLFEIADLKIASRPWYIDCKNYGEFTLDTFSFEDEDEMQYPHPKFSSEAFLRVAQEKIVKLQMHHQSNEVKLLYLNLFSYKPRRTNYLTSSLDEVNTFDEAQIIILPSVLATEDPARPHRDFLTLLNEIKARY